MAGDAEDRTEAASAQQLQKAREQGDIPVSRELPLLAGLAGGSAALAVQLSAAGPAPLIWFAGMLRRRSLSGDPPFASAISSILTAELPTAFGAVAAVLAIGVLQSGFLLRIAALQPDFSRISPMRGIKRMFSVDTLMQGAKSAAKLGVLAFVMWLALRRLLPSLGAAARWQPGVLRGQMAAEATHLIVVLCGAQAVIAMADVAWVRLQHAKKQRMTRQQVRDEHKESDGNPQVKQRLRQLARTRAKRRMMAAIRTAAVVVTNPEHYAVALHYQKGSSAAPRVVAKGAGEVAARIREEARTYHIPMVANPPLARALYRVELDAEIPVEHFKAVAEIVAYIWRLRGRPVR
jgi:flagellar biosynthetic protein FlhB